MTILLFVKDFVIAARMFSLWRAFSMTARPDLDTCRGEGITVIYILSTLAVTIGADDVSQSRVSKCQIIIVSWQIFVSFGGNFFPPASQVGAAAARSPPVAAAVGGPL